MLREDRATRALALAKQRGELSLGWVAFRAPDETLGLGGVRQVSKLDPAFVSADPSATLADSRIALHSAVDKLTTDQGLVLVSASVDVDQTTQLLSVRVTAPSGTAPKELTSFAQAVGLLVDTLNAKQAQVGVSYVWATDPDGKTLGVGLHDFAIGLDGWYPAVAAS
jgi:hypothetical protein